MAWGLVPRRRASSAATRSTVVGSLRVPAPPGPRYGASVRPRVPPPTARRPRHAARATRKDDRQREADQESGRDEVARHRGVPTEAVEDAVDPRRVPGRCPCDERRARGVVGLAVVDEHRQVVAAGEVEHAREHLALHLRRAVGAIAVEPDLADRDHRGICRHLLDPPQVRLRGRGRPVGVDPDRRDEKLRMAGGQRDRGLGRGRSQPGTTMRVRPAATARSRTASRSVANAGSWRWQCESTMPARRSGARCRLRAPAPRPAGRRAGRSAAPGRSVADRPRRPRRAGSPDRVRPPHARRSCRPRRAGYGPAARRSG